MSFFFSQYAYLIETFRNKNAIYFINSDLLNIYNCKPYLGHININASFHPRAKRIQGNKLPFDRKKSNVAVPDEECLFGNQLVN